MGVIRRFDSCPTTLVATLAPFAFFFFAAWQAWHFVDSRCQMRGRRGTSGHRARHTSESRRTGCSKVSPLLHRFAFSSLVVAKAQLFIVHAHPVGRQKGTAAPLDSPVPAPRGRLVDEYLALFSDIFPFCKFETLSCRQVGQFWSV